jgi:hypothetical protein
VNVPFLPTDNLYKFLALSGVVMVIASSALVWIISLHVDEQITNLEVESALIKEEIRFLEEDVATPERRGDNGSVNPTTREGLRREIARNAARLGPEIQQTKRLNRDLWLLVVFYVVFLFGGFYAAYKGFRLWYDRLQRYQDVLLQAQAKPSNTCMQPQAAGAPSVDAER